MTGAVQVWRALRRGAGRDSHLPAGLALVAFAVTTAALLVCAGGLQAFQMRADTTDAPGADYYVMLATIACAVMVVRCSPSAVWPPGSRPRDGTSGSRRCGSAERRPPRSSF